MSPFRLLAAASLMVLPLIGAAQAQPHHPTHAAQVRTATYRVSGHATHRARMHTAQLSTRTLHHRPRHTVRQS